MRYKAIVIGSSAGGLKALKKLLTKFGKDFKIPIIIVQHTSPNSDNYITTYLNDLCELEIKEADEKEPITGGHVYFAPPNFHLMVEEDFSLSLSVEDRVNFARPAIDVLFDTAADCYKAELIGIVLTGANNDGSRGLKKIKRLGGLTIVQDPETAEVESMPVSAIKTTKVDHILSLTAISKLLIKINQQIL